MKSISAKVIRNDPAEQNSDLWLAFLLENKLLQTSDSSTQVCDQVDREIRSEDPVFMVKQLDHYQKLPSESFSTNVRNDYEEIHMNCPGLFWDTVSMDNPDKAFKKTKRIIKDIVNSQKHLKPMFDIDFANMEHPVIKQKLSDICKQIAPHRLFY